MQTEPLVGFTVRVTETMAERLRERAESADRTVAAHVRRLIREDLDRNPPEKDHAA